jgi:hypothetical protein
VSSAACSAPSSVRSRSARLRRGKTGSALPRWWAWTCRSGRWLRDQRRPSLREHAGHAPQP